MILNLAIKFIRVKYRYDKLKCSIESILMD